MPKSAQIAGASVADDDGSQSHSGSRALVRDQDACQQAPDAPEPVEHDVLGVVRLRLLQIADDGACEGCEIFLGVGRFSSERPQIEGRILHT